MLNLSRVAVTQIERGLPIPELSLSGVAEKQLHSGYNYQDLPSEPGLSLHPRGSYMLCRVWNRYRTGQVMLCAQLGPFHYKLSFQNNSELDY